MTTALRFEIAFHGPFRVESGSARDGMAATVDRRDLLPASSLKGLMRASAAQLLPRRPELVNEVFGASRSASPWHWSSAEFAGEPVVERRARIQVDDRTGAARPGAFFLAEEVWADTARFEVTRHRYLEPAVLERHVVVLTVAAAGVHGLGADRRRGLGWVSVRPLDPPLDDALLAAFERLDPGGGASDVGVAATRPAGQAEAVGGQGA